MNNASLTIKQGYIAMYLFLEKLKNLTESAELESFLGSMTVHQNGYPTDSEIWQDWLDSVNTVLATGV
jgi:hypothetical protein